LLSYNRTLNGKFKNKQHMSICFKWTKLVRLASKLICSNHLRKLKYCFNEVCILPCVSLLLD
jgi:hypothetical protein